MATRIPIGIAIAAPRPTMIAVPTNALPIPPVASRELGSAFWVRKSRLIEPIPFTTMLATTSASTPTASTAAIHALTSIARLASRRRRRLPLLAVRRGCGDWPPPSTLGPPDDRSAHQEPGDGVEDQREHEQDHREVRKRRDLQVGRRALVGVGDLAR